MPVAWRCPKAALLEVYLGKRAVELHVLHLEGVRLQLEIGDADSKGPRLKLWGSWVLSKGEDLPEADQQEPASDNFNAVGTARISLADVLRAGQTEGAWKVRDPAQGVWESCPAASSFLLRGSCMTVTA